MDNKQIIRLAASLNGKKGGVARKEALTSKRRKEIARLGGIASAKARRK